MNYGYAKLKVDFTWFVKDTCQKTIGGDMIIEIKNVRECKNKAFGNFFVKSKGKMLITISQKKNDNVAEYASTILHEMLHAWVTVLRLQGFKVTGVKEHRFIYAVERRVLELLHLIKRRK